MQDFRKLRVWAESHQLTLAIYEATGSFPAAERFGLSAQLRRAAASIPTNLAEGCGRHTTRDLARFVSIASGSASEVDYQLQLARDLGLLDSQTYDELSRRTVAVRRMLRGLHQRLGRPT